MNMDFPGRRNNSSVVAQDCILLYRGFPIRRPSAKPGGIENPAPSRLEIGDTADLEICAPKNFVLHTIYTWRWILFGNGGVFH